MNYQTTALWIYAPLYLLLFLLVIGLAFIGLSAPVFYGLAIGLVFPVIISMRLHTLSENGQAQLVKEISDWTVYVQGIPVQEKRASLKNPCFFTSGRIQQFYLRGFIARLGLQVAALCLLAQQMRANPLSGYLALAGAAALIFLLAPLCRTVLTLRKVHRAEWTLQKVAENGSYQAFFIDNKGAHTALSRLLSLW